MKNEGGVYCPENLIKSDEKVIISSENGKNNLEKIIDNFNHTIKNKIDTIGKKIEVGSNFSFKNKNIKFESGGKSVDVKNFSEGSPEEVLNDLNKNVTIL